MEECGCIIRYPLRLNMNRKTLSKKTLNAGKGRGTNRRRGGRNLLYRRISPLAPLLRRAAHLLPPINTLSRPFNAPFAGGSTATLNLSRFAVFARLKDSATGDETRGRNTSYGSLRGSLRLVVVILDWYRSGHRERDRDRHGHGHRGRSRVCWLTVIELVGLEMERVADSETSILDWLRDRTVPNLRNGN